MDTLQRDRWNGPPESLPDAFRMTKPKGNRVWTATCELWTHQLGWEPRLQIDGRGLSMTSVARNATEMAARVDEWQAAMVQGGWTEA